MVDNEIRKMDQQTRDLIFPEAHGTIEDIFQYLDEDPKRTVTTYGHSLGMLAQVAYANCESMSFDEQKKKMREGAEYLVKKYGHNIVKVMRPELREALGIESVDSLVAE